MPRSHIYLTARPVERVRLVIPNYKVRYSEDSLFRTHKIISYTWRFDNPKMQQGSLIRPFVALFRRFVIPKVRFFPENEMGLHIPKVR